MKVSERVETLFSQAAALHQSGRLRNTIYCHGDCVYILNQDNTVLLRFKLHPNEKPFESSVGFDASDYDSQELEEKDGRVEFLVKEDEFLRTKSCKTPRFTAEQVAGLFQEYGRPVGSKIILPGAVRKLVDEELSHIEFSARGGQFKIVQRNIYTGTVITIENKPEGFDMMSEDLPDFGPMGMRTDDFLSLYTFADSVHFWFGHEKLFFVRSDDISKVDMRGVVSQCIYDELGGELKDREEKPSE